MCSRPWFRKDELSGPPKGPVIIYRLGVGVGGFWGRSLDFLGEQKGGSVVTESPKGGDH